MLASEHAPCGPYSFLERRHGLAQISERGGGVTVSTQAACYAQELKNLKRETWSAKQPLRAP